MSGNVAKVLELLSFDKFWRSVQFIHFRGRFFCSHYAKLPFEAVIAALILWVNTGLQNSLGNSSGGKIPFMSLREAVTSVAVELLYRSAQNA